MPRLISVCLLCGVHIFFLFMRCCHFIYIFLFTYWYVRLRKQLELVKAHLTDQGWEMH
jgi:hypothetical protein